MFLLVGTLTDTISLEVVLIALKDDGKYSELLLMITNY